MAEIAKSKWWRDPQANGNVWHWLYVDGRRTPYFIDVACDKLHKSYGKHRIGLWGSGLHKSGGAAFLGGFDTLTLAKAAAIRALTASMEGASSPA